jgi:O-antigen ligase
MQSIAVFVFIALPWLNPFSFGPAPSVVPWLVTLASLALVLLLAARVGLAELAPAAWLAAAVISALFGLLQYFGLSGAFEPWVNFTVPGEAYANLRQRNQFATLTNIGLATLLWWFPQGHWPVAPPASLAEPLRAAGGKRHLVAMGLAAALATGNAASSSRTGLAQLLMLLAMAWWWGRPGDAALTQSRGGWQPSDLRWVALTAALAYGMAAFALPLLAGLDPQASGILARLHEGDPQCSSRLTLWSNVLHLIAQKPLFGWGWGELDYAHFITLYPGARFCQILDNAHNLPLHLAVELGLPAALLLCAGAVWAVWRARPWREQDATRRTLWAVLALILLHSLLEYPLWYGPFQLTAGLCLWLLWRSAHRSVQQATRQPKLAVYLVPGAAVLLALSGCGAIEYHRISQIYRSPEARSEAYRDNTLEKIGSSWLFSDQVRFAQLTTSTLTLNNAANLHQLALEMLHFSPEPRVIEMLIESSTLLGHEADALFYLQRYHAAFPESHARWAKEQATPKGD